MHRKIQLKSIGVSNDDSWYLRGNFSELRTQFRNKLRVENRVRYEWRRKNTSKCVRAIYSLHVYAKI